MQKAPIPPWLPFRNPQLFPPSACVTYSKKKNNPNISPWASGAWESKNRLRSGGDKWKVPHPAGVLDTRGNVHTGEFQWDCSSLGLRVKDLKARLVTWMCGEGGDRSHKEWQGLRSAERIRPHLRAFRV